jgi:nucleotide-binding universal stress UspA family protein
VNGVSTVGLVLTNILHLTDFSSCSNTAFRWAIGIARANQAKLRVLHVVVPNALMHMAADSPDVALDAQENRARGEMQRMGERLVGLPHDMIVKRSSDVWMAAEDELEKVRIDMLVLGTHGRTGLNKLSLGSVAERVLRGSTVPVMMVGPAVAPLELDGKFHRLLLATDFTDGSAAAGQYATTLAHRDEAELALLYICAPGKPAGSEKVSELSVAEAFHRLHELARDTDTPRGRMQTIVEFGDAGARILDVAMRIKADLIVMGARTAKSVLAVPHLEIGAIHNVVARASCPVLTVPPAHPGPKRLSL